MPFITLVIVSILGRGEELTKDLPKWAGTGFLVILYLTIGSTFAMPRITNVAYEMAWLPLGLVEDNASVRFLFSVIFNLIAMGFMIRPNTIISSVGKFMTPALLVLLVAVAVTVFISPLSEIKRQVKPMKMAFFINRLNQWLSKPGRTRSYCFRWNRRSRTCSKKCNSTQRYREIHYLSWICFSHFTLRVYIFRFSI